MDQSARSEFAILHLDASYEGSQFSVEVINFEIEEALSTAFKVQVYFLSASPKLPFEDIIGRGGALSLHTGVVGDRAWAGVVTEFELLHSEEHTGSYAASAAIEGAAGGASYKGRSRYRVVIQPDLYRLSLRKNSRIFQDMNAVEIVKLVLKDWNIEVDPTSKLTEDHPKFDYKVQYQETDFDFVSRILEDAGITYWIRPTPEKTTQEKKKGDEITKLILRDVPTSEPSVYDGSSDEKTMPYLGDGPEKHHDMGPHMWLLSAKQWPRPLKRTIRDHDFKMPLDGPPEGTTEKKLEGRPAIESQYEWFEYRPGAYWYAHQGSGGGPSAAKYAPGTSATQRNLLPERRYEAALAGRTIITFKTNDLKLEPSAVFQIGKDGDKNYDFNHPHPAFAPAKKIMVISRKITGKATGSAYESECTAVYADEKFRPAIKTPKPHINGIQSAVVVGPGGQEIHVDEYGRVRVQFLWDRYNKFNDDSSCWIRVSHAWAGNSFGFIAHPRIGQEVIVGFYEGDPDQPVIVGRLYNEFARPPYPGPNATKSGFKSNSTGGGGAGYNELSFEDDRGKEMIHIQAQKDLSFVVNDNESHDVGTALAYKVGKSESHDIGQSLAFKIGMTESHEMFQSFNVKVGLPGMSTELKMDTKSIVLSTGKASITLSEDNIFIEGKKEIHIHSGKKLHISSSEDVDVDAKEMTIDTVNKLLLNCQTAEIHEAKAADAGYAMPPAGPAHGSTNPAQWTPSQAPAAPVLPGALEQVNVGNEEDEKPKKAIDNALEAIKGGDPLKAIEQVTGKVDEAKADLTKLLDFGKAIKDGNIGDAIKNLPGGLADVPIISQAVKAAHGIDMTLETLAKDINAQIVTPLQSSFATAMKVVDEHIPGPVKDILASKLGQDFKNAAVKKVLQDIGVDGGSFGDLASKGMDKLLKEVGVKEGKSALSKALFKGATDELHGYAKTAFGDKGLESLITENFGGKAAKSTPVETAAKALTSVVKLPGGK